MASSLLALAAMHSEDTDDLGEMLAELADADYRPVVHPASDGAGWVAYAQAPCRVFFIGEGSDPESAVRCLYVHTFDHPTAPPPPVERRPAPAVARPAREPAVIPRPACGVQVAMRPSQALCEALHAMAETARRSEPASIDKAMEGSSLVVTQGALLLIIRRDHAEQVLTERFDQLDRIAMVVDRRLGDRRTLQHPPIANQRRRADRRTRTWVETALATDGIALVRM